MKNFIFKSPPNSVDLHKIYDLVKILATEQRMQRSDLAFIKSQLKIILPEFIEQQIGDTEDGTNNPEHGE